MPLRKFKTLVHMNQYLKEHYPGYVTKAKKEFVARDGRPDYEFTAGKETVGYWSESYRIGVVETEEENDGKT